MSSKELAKRVQKSVIGMRPVLPLAQRVDLGSVGTIDDEGQFRYQGTIGSMLGLNYLGGELEPVSKPDLQWSTTVGKNVRVGIGAKADTSGELAQFANAKGVATISFGAANSTFVAVKGLTVRGLAEPRLLMDAILSAYRRGAWSEDMVFVYQVGIAHNLTIIMSRDAGTKVALKASARVAAAAAADVDLAVGFKMQIATNAVEQVSGARNLVAFYNAYRVSDRWWKAPKVEQADMIAFGTEIKDVANPIADDAFLTEV